MRTHTNPLSPEPLRIPYDGDRSSGYRHVYYRGEDVTGASIWEAKVKVGVEDANGRYRVKAVAVPGSRSRWPRESAQAVARWYFERYGPNWPAHLKRSPLKPYAVRYSERYGGWVARVWVQGKPHEVRAVRHGRACERLRVFETQKDAVRGARWFLWWLLGYLQPEYAFRCVDQTALVPGV